MSTIQQIKSAVKTQETKKPFAMPQNASSIRNGDARNVRPYKYNAPQLETKKSEMFFSK